MSRFAVALVRLAASPVAPASDAHLLRTFVAAQGEDAFAELVRRHGPMVLAVCRRALSDAHDAEDAFQAVFLVLARKAGTVRGTNVAAWLYGVAVRTARGVRVMRDRRRKHERASGGFQPPDTARIADHDTAAVIDEELAKLPDCYRDAVVLCELRGLSRKQAAAELGVPEGTLSSRLAAAKRKLAGRLAARGLAGAALVAALAPAVVSAALLESTALAVRGAAGGVANAAASAVLKGMLFDQLKAVVLSAAVCLTAVCGGLAMTGTPSDAPPGKAASPAPAPAPRPVEDPAAPLVKQLGSADFAEREAAQKDLRKLGLKAEGALKAGLKSDDPEIRARCAKLLAEVRKDALDALVKGFDPAADNPSDHPVWKRFVAIAGDSRASRELFARIIANKKWIQTLDNAEANPTAAGHVYRVGIAEMFRDFDKDPAKSPQWPCDRPEEVAYLLLLGSYPDNNPPAKLTGDEICPTSLRNTDFLGRGIIHGEGQITHANGLSLGLDGKIRFFNAPEIVGAVGTDRVFAKLFAAWFVRRDPSSEVVPRGFRIVSGQRVPEILPFARRIAANDFEPKRDVPPIATIAALELVAQDGTRADLPLFERHFGDKTNVAAVDKPRADAIDYHRPAPLKDTTQLRDVALGLALLLHGENPEDFGFVVRKDTFIKQKDGRYAIPWSTQLHLGFDSEATRTAAFKKAKAWLVEQKPKAEPPAAPKPDPAPAKLVEQLGSADFAEREAAQKQLKELGSKARGALEAGLKSENAEVVKRCRELLEHLARAEFDTKHWARFAKVIGDDKASRALFERIRSQRRNVELLNAVVADPKAAGKLYHDRWAELNDEAHIPNGVGGYQIVAAPLADAGGWMYLGTFPGAEGAFHTSNSIVFLPDEQNPRDPLMKALKDDTISVPLRKLIGAWTAARIDYSGRELGFQLALKFDIKEVLPAARETVAAKVKDDPYPGNTARNVGRAMLLLGKLGSKDDLPLLESRAASEDVCAVSLIDPQPEPGKPRILLPRWPKDGRDATAQLRDVSAAMRLHLIGADPDAFRFYWHYPWETDRKPVKPEDRFYLYSIGFIRNTDRVAAHKKAKEWLDKQKK